jgi:hypothetical protein
MNRSNLSNEKCHNLDVKLSGCYVIMKHVMCGALCIVTRLQAGQ